MKIRQHKAKWVGGVILGVMLCSGSLMAQDGSVSISGFIRQEMAYNIGDENPYNQSGNTFNGVPTTNVVTSEVITRPDFNQDNDWNLMATRMELNIGVLLSKNWNASLKLRGFFDNKVYRDFGEPNHFESGFWGDCGGALEICDENYMVDLPSAYLDYNSGPVWLRIGNQQIAWGESIFFRVLDVPSGLDLRRHSFLDWTSEEYADERVAAPAIRGSVNFADVWELEGFVQMFSPTIFGGENTPYNTINAPFIRHETEAFDDARGDLSTGIRLRGQIGELGVQFMAVNRRNPDGVFSWTESGVNAFAGIGIPALEDLGALVAMTPFEPGTAQGVYSAQEWHTYAALARLSGVEGVHAAVNDFPVAFALADGLGLPTTVADYNTASIVLDAFFSPAVGLSNLRGHIKRKYPWENVFGFGLNYMFFGEQSSFLDQLMVRFEATFTPDKKFTDIGLAQRPIEEDEIATSMVLEKYHRFSDSFPATFMVLQWLHKTESDMFGRHLSGYDGSRSKPASGRSNFDALAFALQQPSPTLKWRFDFAVLYDVEGGYLMQPGVRWKPNRSWTVEAYGNFLDGDNGDVMGTFEWADEIGMRVGYQF